MAVLADASDEVEGKTRLVGIFQSLVVSQFPTALQGVLAIRVAFERDDPEFVEVVATFRRGLDQLAELSVPAFVPPATFAQPLRGLDVTIDLAGTRIFEPGVYAFDVAVDGDELASVPLSIVRAGPVARA